MPTNELARPLRGEVWLVDLDKIRPAVVLTRDPMGRILNSVIVGPVTSTVRGISTEVPVGPGDGVLHSSVVNMDNLQLIPRSLLVRRVGRVRASTLVAICVAVTTALGCAPTR